MSHARDLPRQSSERRLGAAAKKDESMSEIERLVWHEVAPHGARALFGVHHYVTTGNNLQEEMIHLVFLRVSQIKGCAHCINLHTRALLKTMRIDKVVLLPVWAEVPYIFGLQLREDPALAE